MLPVLYSFRRCPYAIRARLAIRYSGVQVLLREVILSDKPQELIAISSKATVPVLQLADGQVIDESRDIIDWALSINDPDSWLSGDEVNRLIDANDGAFKQHLDHYKYADRFPDYPAHHYRQLAEIYIQQLELLLEANCYLFGNKLSVADVAIFPFIRQFAYVDKHWFDNSEYVQVQRWLERLLTTDLFESVMAKYPQWKTGDSDIIF